MAMPLGAREVRLLGAVPACWFGPTDGPLSETMQRLLARTAELMKVGPQVIAP
jgi:hypothetical protein